jgi:hypothetical protein
MIFGPARLGEGRPSKRNAMNDHAHDLPANRQEKILAISRGIS